MKRAILFGIIFLSVGSAFHFWLGHRDELVSLHSGRPFVNQGSIASDGSVLLHHNEHKEPESRQAKERRHIEKVFLRNWDALLEHPAIDGVTFANGGRHDHRGLIIISDRPSDVPTEIEGVPVKVIPPTPTLPPPPGVVVLKPDGTHERRPDLASCPPRFKEKQVRRWRFCQPVGRPQRVPQLMKLPVGGVPYVKAKALLKRYRNELLRLPGVNGLELGQEALIVYTDHPELVPSDIEGLPVEAKQRTVDYINRGSSHTALTPENPLHGSVIIEDRFFDSTIPGPPPPQGLDGAGTLAGIVLSEGKPWGVTNGHNVKNCASNNIPCNAAVSPLNACPHYSGDPFDQPPANLSGIPIAGSRLIGHASRWAPFGIGPPAVTDVAAIFLDNDGIEGNGSLVAERKIEESSGTPSQIPFKGTVTEMEPNLGDPILIMNTVASGETHVISGSVITTRDEPVNFGCNSNQPVLVRNSLVFRTDTELQFGGSGSLIVTPLEGDIVAMQSWIRVGGPFSRLRGGGVLESDMKEELGYDHWYGTETAKDNTFGIFNNGRWQLDNGDGQWTGTGGTTPDQEFFFGLPGDLPVTGNWTGTGGNTLKIGTWRPLPPGSSLWFLDNGNGAWNGCGVEQCYSGWGRWNDIPVAGNWVGSEGTKTKIGIFRKGLWFLDDGDGVWEGCGVEQCFGPWGAPDRPVVGDWNGDGKTQIGTYRPGTGQWFLDDGNYVWDGCEMDKCVGPFGLPDDRPVSGNWTGVGSSSKIGVFEPTSLAPFASPATWVLDNGNGTFENYAREQKLGPFGPPTGWPVAWNKSSVKGN